MDAKTLERKLLKLGACSEAREWARGKSLAEVYAQFHRADWWLWLAARVGVDRRAVVLAACACARTALGHMPAGEERPLRALETAEAWAREEPGVTLGDVRKAAAAADAADADRKTALASMVPLVKQHLPLAMVEAALETA